MFSTPSAPKVGYTFPYKGITARDSKPLTLVLDGAGIEVQHRDRKAPSGGALKEVGMGAKKRQVDSEVFRDNHREERGDGRREELIEALEFDVPDEMETWALDDMSDLVPTMFD
jgi:hypothetical protein